MSENEVKNIFNDSPESDNLIYKIYKKYGFDIDTLGIRGVRHDFDVIPFAEAEAEILQNAFNRGLTTIETIRLAIEGRLLIDATLKEFREKKLTS